MIGQKNLMSRVNEMVEANKFPRFTILVGLPGSGRRTMARYIATKMNTGIIEYPTGVDEMRIMIANAHKVTSPYVFVIPNADNMSPAAKNCILKVTEEPPQNVYFIMTVSDINSVLETIRSRGTVFYMDKYSADEVVQFIDADNQSSGNIALVSNVCETPGDVALLMNYNPAEFSEYVNKVVDNLEVVSVANMYKIANKIKLKDTQDGYDLRLFFRMFINVCMDRLRSNVLRYGNWVRLTNKKLQELQITGVNKSMLFDAWLTDVKGVD